MKNKKIIVTLLLSFSSCSITAQSSDGNAVTGNNYSVTKFLGWNTTSGDLSFRTNNVNRMTLQNTTGYLGIGASPTSLLHLNSTTTGNVFRTDGPIGSLNQWQLFTNNEKFRLSVPTGCDNVVQNAVNADGSFALQTTFC